MLFISVLEKGAFQLYEYEYTVLMCWATGNDGSPFATAQCSVIDQHITLANQICTRICD